LLTSVRLRVQVGNDLTARKVAAKAICRGISGRLPISIKAIAPKNMSRLNCFKSDIDRQKDLNDELTICVISFSGGLAKVRNLESQLTESLFRITA
jgi:hypothetical protein